MRRLLIAAATVAAVLVPPASAAAAASPTASCLGVGSSANAGYPRDRAAISHDVKVLADAFGTTSGALISGSARQHLGSPGACFGD
jgi:hypothetical protein